jgi:hypothetical protein
LSRYKYCLRWILRRSQDAGDRLVETTRDEVKKSLFSTTVFANAVTLGIIWLLRDYLELGSVLFFIVIGWLLFVFYISWTRFRRWAIPALAILLPMIAINFSSASHYIASDQFRIKYRSIEGVTYFEFPAHAPFLKWLAKKQKEKELIEVTQCSDQTVATLPLLPYAAIHVEQDSLLSPYPFRRLPSLKIERFDYRIEVSSGSAFGPDGQKTLISAEFGFPSSDFTASIPVTLIFPRSTKCVLGGFPFFPILEALPWDPNDTDSLIKAVKRSDQLRKLYQANQVLSLEAARDLQMSDDDSNYKALFDFIFYSVAFHSFPGNVLSEVRSKIGDKLCSIASGHANAFNGPFSSLPEQFLQTIVVELGSRYQLAYPACLMPNDRLDSFQNLIDDEAEMSAGMVTFRNCLDTSSSVAKCLEQDDLVQPSKGTTTPRSSALQGEPLLAVYDERFEDFIATNDGKTVKIQTINPTDCPRLRDEIEESYFVNWWIDRANEITTAPASCSSADWKSKVVENKALIESAVSCATKLGLKDIPKPADATFTIDYLSRFRCNPSANAADIDRASKAIADFMDGLESTISKLKTFQPLVGDQPLGSIIDAFEMLIKSKIAACATESFRQCIEGYRAKGSLLETINKFNPIGDPSIFSLDKEMVRHLTNLDNTLIDMAICDLLQDDEFAKRTGYSREAYCDDHKLHAYRLFGSSDLGRSLERADKVIAGKRYSYQLGKTHREYLIELPLGDRPKSP